MLTAGALTLLPGDVQLGWAHTRVWYADSARGQNSIADVLKSAAKTVPSEVLAANVQRLTADGRAHITNSSARVTCMTNLLQKGATDAQIKAVRSLRSPPRQRRWRPPSASHQHALPRAGHWSSLRLLPHVLAPYHGNLRRTERRRNLRPSPKPGAASSAGRPLRPSSGASPPHGPATCFIARQPHPLLAAAPGSGILAHAHRCYAAGSLRHQRRLHAGNVPLHVHAQLGEPCQPPPMPCTAHFCPIFAPVRVLEFPPPPGRIPGILTVPAHPFCCRCPGVVSPQRLLGV